MLEPVSFIILNFNHLPVFTIVLYAIMFFGIVIAIKFGLNYPNLPTMFMVLWCAPKKLSALHEMICFDVCLRTKLV